MNKTELEIKSILDDMYKAIDDADGFDVDIIDDTFDLIKQEIGYNE